MISLVFSFDPKPVIAFGFISAKMVPFFESSNFVDLPKHSPEKEAVICLVEFSQLLDIK